MNYRKRNLLATIISGSLFVIILALELVFALTGIAQKIPVLTVLLIVFAPVFAIMAIALLIRFLSLERANRQLINENVYNLGEAIAFYDLHAFDVKVTTLSKSRRAKSKAGQYIIAFTCSTLIAAQNLDRDENYAAFNGKTAEIVEKVLTPEKKIGRRTNAFCFNHGVFLIYLMVDEDREIRDVVNNISDELFKTEQTGTTSVSVSPFFGVAPLEKGASVVETVENASIARNVSERNFESLTYYHESFRKRSSRSEVEEISNALSNNEFVVFYQPKFNLATRKFVSSEALVRWDSKRYGLLSPAKFIPIAEQAGLIHEIDTFVFKRVCEDLNEAKRRGRRLIPVSVNFSLYEFFSTNFLNSILELLEEYKISPSLIEIEITEATSQTNTFMSVSIIKKLRDRGIRVLMDDFGVGFSNIGNLRKIPFDAVKIDKSFIDDIVTDAKSRAIVKFLIELCQANDMEVIAEGVDNKEQCEILKKMKCNTIQGFYYSKALPIKEYEKFLLSNPFEKKEASN
ncbi:MAG: EAL domain-containing protein [Bacilli bacterium]|nr:EAL domain-containing protein [Bacilli bacterium]